MFVALMGGKTERREHGLLSNFKQPLIPPQPDAVPAFFWGEEGAAVFKIKNNEKITNDHMINKNIDILIIS
jgi:hypothetical protein